MQKYRKNYLEMIALKLLNLKFECNFVVAFNFKPRICLIFFFFLQKCIWFGSFFLNKGDFFY